MLLIHSALCLVSLLMSRTFAPNEFFHCKGSEAIDDGWSISFMYSETYLGKGQCVSNLTRNNSSDTVFDGRRRQNRDANARGYE